jgi:6-pyruvoyltetrahydropterin/6-carboxytetrahydropterin synthase
MIKVSRYHDFSCGHRVHGHESKCAYLHGHNYRATFVCAPAPSYVAVTRIGSAQSEAVAIPGTLDSIGRVLDFSVIKARLCEWLEVHWDHRFLAWEEDTVVRELVPACAPGGKMSPAFETLLHSIVWVPFNPTAENMAQYLLNIVAPRQLAGTGVECASVILEETRKCSATATIGATHAAT